MMAKIILWIVIIGGLGAGGYAVVKNNEAKDAALTAEETTTEEQPAEQSGKKMAFSAFLKMDTGSYKCTVRQAVSDMESSGTVYLDAGKLRGDFTTVAEGRTITSSILSKDGYQYIWSPQMQGGMKMKVSSIGEGNAQAQASGTYSWNAEEIGEYDCDPWTADAATFALPSGIVFTDLSAMLKTR